MEKNGQYNGFCRNVKGEFEVLVIEDERMHELDPAPDDRPEASQPLRKFQGR